MNLCFIYLFLIQFLNVQDELPVKSQYSQMLHTFVPGILINICRIYLE